MVERSAVNRNAVGSSPTQAATKVSFTFLVCKRDEETVRATLHEPD